MGPLAGIRTRLLTQRLIQLCSQLLTCSAVLSSVNMPLAGEVIQIGGFTVPVGNMDVLHPNADPRGQDPRDGAPREPEIYPAMNQIELTKTYDYVDLGPIPKKSQPLKEHWEPVFCAADVLKKALKQVQMDVVASTARWIHEWTKQYPTHNMSPGLSRSVPTQLDRIRKAATDLNRSATAHQTSRRGQEAQRLLLELSRLAKLHRRDLEAWREEVDHLTDDAPATVQFCRGRSAK
jgi:hypothetical protein